jgi:tetratricopeptide (TPR) repeat protein
MRRIALYFTAVVIFILALVIMQGKRNKVCVRETAPALRSVVPEVRPKETAIQVIETVGLSIEGTDEKEIKEYIKEFGISEKMEQELLVAVRDGNLEEEKETQELTEEDVRKLKTIVRHLGASSISAGYKVSDKTLDEIIKGPLEEEPDVPPEDPEPKDPQPDPVPGPSKKPDGLCRYSSETLAMLGFSAMAALNYEEAEDLFRALLYCYPDSQEAPMVRLELARLLFEQGRINDAQQEVDEAIKRHDDDRKYVQMAEELRMVIEGDE